MKYTLLVISVLCLSFTFVKSVDIADNDVRQEITSASPDESITMAARGTSVSDVVTKALAFKALLTTTQQATLELPYTPALARKWSNLTCGGSCRNGIQFATLTNAQLDAAQALIKSALGRGAPNGYYKWTLIRLAEANLHANGGGSAYDTGQFWIAFLNTPTTTGQWMLQFGGHHYAANIAFNNGHVVGATPFYMGVEPATFTVNGNTVGPLNAEQGYAAAFLSTLSSSQLSTAKLSQTFSDCVLIPGESNGGSGTFPATKVGLSCSTLDPGQRSLLLTYIANHVYDIDSTTSVTIMNLYESEINNTYVAYTGNGYSGNAIDFLKANTNYFRVDGPSVWVELSCQNGEVYPNQIHYHTVWRDHSRDYGVDLTGAAIDDSSTISAGVAIAKTIGALNVFPNPAGNTVSASLNKEVSDADLMIISAATGEKLTTVPHRSGSAFSCNVSRMPSGVYLIRIEDANSIYIGKFTKR